MCVYGTFPSLRIAAQAHAAVSDRAAILSHMPRTQDYRRTYYTTTGYRAAPRTR